MLETRRGDMYISLRMEIREALAFKVYAQIEASDVE